MTPETQQLITWIVATATGIVGLGVTVWKLRDSALAAYWKAIGARALTVDEWMARALEAEGDNKRLTAELKLAKSQRNDFARALLEIEQLPQHAEQIVDAVLLASIARTARPDMPTPLGLEEITGEREEDGPKLLGGSDANPAD